MNDEKDMYSSSSVRQDWEYRQYGEGGSFSQPKVPPEKKSRNRGRAAFRLLIGLVCGVIFGSVASAVYIWDGERRAPAVQESEAAPEASEEIGETEAPKAVTFTVSDVAEHVMPAVVTITNTSVQELEYFFGYRKTYESVSSGSGILIGTSGNELYIATNNHVIADARTISVGFIDETAAEAVVKGTDEKNDLAVLSVNLKELDADTRSKIRCVVLGDSDEVVVGQQVVAIGNALGYGQSITSGYISALDRQVEDGEALLLQTDAAINPGNSGGALLNMKGELIGINSSKYASMDVEGMGYAIPISVAGPILEELMVTEPRQKISGKRAAYLGVSCKNITQEAAEMYGMPLGAYVDKVEDGTPAMLAGLQQGDILVRLDDQEIQSYDDLVSALSYYAAGETVELTYARAEDGEYKEHTVQVMLSSKKA